jgi:hypothetical protein
MKIIVRPSWGLEKPYQNVKTGVDLTEEDIVEMVTRKVRTRLATLEDRDDELIIEIYIDEVNRD